MKYKTHEELMEEIRNNSLQALTKLLVSLTLQNKKWDICTQVLNKKITQDDEMTGSEINLVLVFCILENL